MDPNIQQMEAFGNLLVEVARSVDQFVQDNVSENQARDYLVMRFEEPMTKNSEDIKAS